MQTRIALILAAGAALLAAGVGTARAGTAAAPRLFHAVSSSTSSNWSGYAVSGASASPVSFTSVSGAWTQPAVICTRGSASYSAFWVGLGGFAQGSQALEQIGTESDCTASGQARYSAWYELVPAPSVDVSLTVNAGDAIAASVAVSGTTVTMTLTDQTTGQSFTKTATVASPDTTSAEWIAEAPSNCNASGSRCTTLPLANFGTVSFSGSSATGNGAAAGVSGTAWNAEAITLRGSGGSSLRSRFAVAQGSVTATPSALSTDGSSFSVTWAQQAASSTPRPGRGRGRGWGWGFGRGY
ncbi:MAG TPA: G1 family glutamic endopeptidase [Gaiellaceae bacterium]|nr:G1 family glutamic endopeptidase [Gaiellaceae bacterium]